MRYIKEILKKNSIWVLVYIGLGIFNSFVANYKVDYFQKVIDGLADRTLAFAGVATYGFILLVNYGMNYLDNYPEKKLEHGIYLDFKLLSLRKISTIDYTEYQKIGTGKLVQRIENGSAAGRNVLFNFWLCLIRDLLPTIGFSIYFIWEIDEKVTYVLFVGYTVIFIITNILLKFLCNGVQREHNKKLNNGLPILHKVPPKRDYGRYFCIMAEKGGTSHGGLTEKSSPIFHAQKQEVNAYGR